MKQVYVLTEEGRAFSKEGCDYIKELIVKTWQDNSELMFSMGQTYNDTKFLIKALKMNPDSYIAISERKKAITILADENILMAIKCLSEANQEDTCWNILVKDLKAAGIMKERE
jgi:hypothetical protein